MGKKLLVSSAVFRANMESCDELLRNYWPWSLRNVLDDEALLDRTDVAQPALFALEYALARTWQAWGIEPAAVLGHHAGEYVAACIAGVFSLADGLRLIVERGRAMQACPAGAMLACFAPLEKMQEIIRPWAERLATRGRQWTRMHRSGGRRRRTRGVANSAKPSTPSPTATCAPVERFTPS